MLRRFAAMATAATLALTVLAVAPGTAAAASPCTGNCYGKNPHTYTCDRDAYEAPYPNSRITDGYGRTVAGTITLRFSPTCHAAWVYLKSAANGRSYHLALYGLHNEVVIASWGENDTPSQGYAYSNMVDMPTAQAGYTAYGYAWLNNCTPQSGHPAPPNGDGCMRGYTGEWAPNW